MAAINFPDAPSNGDTFTANDKTWVYDTVSWKSLGSSGVSISGGTTVVTDSTAPTSPSDGDLWFDNANDVLYVWDGDAGTPAWKTAASATGTSNISVSNDTSTTTDFYPTFTSATAGNLNATSVSSTKLYFQPSTGTLSATEMNTLSDASLKNGVQTISNGLDVINSIRPVSFNWKDTDQVGYGVIAQELEEILPAIVRENSDKLKSVSYTQLIAFLISAVQEQQKQINELKK